MHNRLANLTVCVHNSDILSHVPYAMQPMHIKLLAVNAGSAVWTSE